MTASADKLTILGIARDDDDESELTVYVDAAGRLRLTATGDLHPADTSDTAAATVPPGVWRHRKGGDYLVLGVAVDDRGGEPRVVYVRLYSRPGLPMTARRVSVFIDSDAAGPRFRWVGTVQPPSGAATHPAASPGAPTTP